MYSIWQKFGECGENIKVSGHLKFLFSEVSSLDKALPMVRGPGRLSAIAQRLAPRFRPARNRVCPARNRDCPARNRDHPARNLDRPAGNPPCLYRPLIWVSRGGTHFGGWTVNSESYSKFRVYGLNRQNLDSGFKVMAPPKCVPREPLYISTVNRDCV